MDADISSSCMTEQAFVSSSRRNDANVSTRAQGPARGAELGRREKDDELGKTMDPGVNAMRTWRWGRCLPEFILGESQMVDRMQRGCSDVIRCLWHHGPS
jgi:hypothetical protein